jgi:hypothetical protein
MDRQQPISQRSEAAMTYLVSDDAKIPADLLEFADRIRQHARHFADDPMGEGLAKYADELEARAHQVIRWGQV